MIIDHIIYVAPDLDCAVDDLATRLGVRAAGGGQHVGQGTHNRLVALGPHTYLEIVAPDPGQPDPDAARPYGVDGVTRAGLVGWALTTDDIEAAIVDARAQGFDPGGVIDGHRLTPDGTALRGQLTNAVAAGGDDGVLLAGLADRVTRRHRGTAPGAGSTISATDWRRHQM